MQTAISVVVLGILFFISVVNYSFRSVECKGKSKEELKRMNALNLPSAWLTYGLSIGLVILMILLYTYYNLMGGISEAGRSQSQTQQLQQSQDQNPDQNSNPTPTSSGVAP